MHVVGASVPDLFVKAHARPGSAETKLRARPAALLPGQNDCYCIMVGGSRNAGKTS